MTWETVIGLEIHVQLATQSKIFSGSATTFGADPNTQASLIDLGMPGVLPVLNKEAVHMAVKFGLAIDAEITPRSVFARKNYFYPDLPKGYQISQYELPIVGKGAVEIHLSDGSKKTIGVTRAHLEEDAGKSLHEDFHGMTGIDLNRAGTPLLEIVSEPDIRSAEEAVAYLKAIHSIIRYIEISDGNMAEGSMRCDVNLSIRPKGQKEFGTRTEIKNVNSFKFVEKAIQVEMERQIDVIETGGSIVQETRLYNAAKNETRSMRSKEEANDYRYFPDPDLLPVEVSEAYIAEVVKELPELPAAKAHRYCDEFGLSDYDASVLVASREIAEYFESAVEAAAGETKLTANWVMGNLMGSLNKAEIGLSDCKIKAQQLGQLVKLIKDNTITSNIAKTVFEKMWDSGEDPMIIVDREGLKPESDSGAIEAMVDKVIADNPKQVEQYLAAPDDKKKKLVGFFVGQIMKASKGKANPQVVNQILAEKLK